jgi:CcmD family protein
MPRPNALTWIPLALLLHAATLVAQTTPGGTLQQEGFVPIEQLPPQDQLPAAPLLIAAYAFVLVVLFAYVFSVAKRLGSVQQQMTRLEGDIARKKGPNSQHG